MLPRMPARPLSASFVATVAVLASCGAEESPARPVEHQNPPDPSATAVTPTATATVVPVISNPPGPGGPVAAVAIGWSDGVKSRQKITKGIGKQDYLNDGPGRCQFAHSMSCPPKLSCNPPPPTPVECTDPKAARPKGKEKWFRVLPQFYAGQYGCSYRTDSFCPAPKDGGGACTEAEAIEIDCAIDKQQPPGKTTIKVPAFLYKDAMGNCHRTSAVTCTDGECKMPEVTDVACK